MKKAIYTFLFSLVVSITAFAQGITINPREKSVEGPNSGDKYALGVITNNSTDPADSMFTWTIIEYNLTAGWEFSFCDNFDCYYNIGMGTTKSFKLKLGESGPLKGDFIFNNIGGNSQVKVVVKSTSNTSIIDTFTMIGRGWATGLNDIKKTADVTFYPNPAKEVITIKQQSNKATEVTIYNVLGSKVKTVVIGSGENTVNISDLQKGMYFIRYTENGTLVSKSFTKAE